MTIKEFIDTYRNCLSETNEAKKPCFEAYLLAEAKHFELLGSNKYKSYESFKISKCQFIRRNLKRKERINKQVNA